MNIKLFNGKSRFQEVHDVEMSFESYLDKIDVSDYSERFSKYKIENMIVIGNGGSINPFLALFNQKDTEIKVFVVNTEDYDLIKEVKSKAPKESSLVVVVSKSGETSTALIDYLAFSEYKKLILTQSETSTLGKLARKNKDDIVFVPNDVGGRYSAFTETVLVPLSILGYDVESIVKVAKDAGLKEDAKKLAWFFYEAENQGFVDLFVPIYSYKASNFYSIITQLIHESFGKDGKGLTVFGGFAPETQHHTNQRFFGGRNNACAMMIYAKSDNDFTIQAKDEEVKKFDNLALSQAVFFEYSGTLNTAVKNNKMVASIEFDSFSIDERVRFLKLFITLRFTLLFIDKLILLINHLLKKVKN